MTGLRELAAQIYFGNTLGQYLAFFGVIVASVVLGRIVHFVFKHQLERAADRTESEIDDALVSSCREPLVLVLFAAGLYFGRALLTLAPRFEQVLTEGALVVVALAITWLLLRLIDIIIHNYVEPLVRKTESKLDDQVLPILRKSTKAVIIILAMIVVLSNLGYDILSVLAGLGIGGLAMALAAQDTVKNVIGGLTIFWDKPFELEDWIEIGGNEGEVFEIGLRSTRLKTEGGTVVVIPNSTVADTPIENYSSRTARRRQLTLGLTYDSSVDQMQTAIDTVYGTIRGLAGTDSDRILVRFVQFGAYSLDLEIVYWITDMANWRMVIHETNMALKRDLDLAGVEMAFPTETHHIVAS